MTNKRLSTVNISGADVSGTLLNWSITESFGNPIYESNLTFSTALNSTIILEEGQSVEIWSGYDSATDRKDFKGEIIDFDIEVGRYKIKAYNELYKAIRNPVNAKIYDKTVSGGEIYPDGKISDAFTDLITTYGKLNADASSVDDSGTDIFLTKFVCNQTNPKERCDKLAEALGWIYYYKAEDDKVYFKPKRFQSNSKTLEVGENVVAVPVWKQDKSDLINDLRLDGLFQQKELSEFFSGDASETVFTLSATPVGKAEVYENSAVNYKTTSPLQQDIKTMGVPNSTIDYDFDVDKANKTITFQYTPGNGTNSILVKYVGVIEVPVHYQDDVSIAQYGTHARTVQLTDVITVDDAENRIREVVEKFKTPFKSTKLKTRYETGTVFEVGEEVRVIDAVNTPNVDDYFTVFKIERNYPTGFDIIQVGDREFEAPEYHINTSERLNRLERELISEGTVLTELRNTTFSMKIDADQLIVTQELINDSFIVDHYINGVIFSESETAVIDPFNTSATWTEGTGSESLTVSNDSVSGAFWISGQGVRTEWTASSGTGVLENTSFAKCISGAVGTNSGTPTQGTAGIWCHALSGSILSGIKLRLGSSTTDYKEYLGNTYSQKILGEAGYIITSGQRNYLLFDLDSPTATSGTPDWTNTDFAQVRWNILSGGLATWDYLTVSRSNYIALNSIGDRTTLKEETTYNY